VSSALRAGPIELDETTRRVTVSGKPVDLSQAWLAPLGGDTAVPAGYYKGKPEESVWLPNQAVAKAWMEYVKTGAVGDTTPPPPPFDVHVTRNGDQGAELSWDAEAELAPYNVSKAGVYLLAKTLARELGSYGIQSNAVGPGLIRTRLSEPAFTDPKFMRKYKNLIPAGRHGLPEDVAGPAVFLASSDAAYVNGVLLFVDGGQLA